MTLFVAASVHADIYRSVDEDGNIVYSDKPSPGAEKIQVDEIQTIKGDEVEPFEYTPPDRGPEVVSPYTALAITSPQNNETIRSNAGDIEVTVDIKPGLIPGHRLVLYLDGNQVAEGGAEIELNNVDRGTHTLNAVIKTSDDRELERSAPVTFTLQRVSVSQQPAGNGNGGSVSPTNPPKPPAPPVSPTNPPPPSP